MKGIEDILNLVCKNFDENSIDYVIVGGFAAIFYGNPRTTMDLDVVIQISEDTDIETVVKFFKKNGFFADTGDMIAAFKEHSHCTVEYKETMFRVDIKGVYNEMDKRTIKNKIKTDFHGKTIYIASPEDTIINKLLCAREQDIKDALGIYARQMGKLDENYIEKEAKKQGVYVQFSEIKEKIKIFKF